MSGGILNRGQENKLKKRINPPKWVFKGLLGVFVVAHAGLIFYCLSNEGTTGRTPLAQMREEMRWDMRKSRHDEGKRD